MQQKSEEAEAGTATSTDVYRVEDGSLEPLFSAGDELIYQGARVVGVFRGAPNGFRARGIIPMPAAEYIAACDAAGRSPVLWDWQDGEPFMPFEMVPPGMTAGPVPLRPSLSALSAELLAQHRIVFGAKLQAHPLMARALKRRLALPAMPVLQMALELLRSMRLPMPLFRNVRV